MILAGLVARRFIRMPHLMRFTLLLWRRLRRAVPRFLRAMARPATIRVCPVRVAKAETARAGADRLPSRRGWLVGELGYEAVGFGLQLEHFLADPAMQAMLAERPALGRMMCPLCRMLGVPAAMAPQPLAAAGSAAATRPAVGGRPARMRGGGEEPIDGPGIAGDCAAVPACE